MTEDKTDFLNRDQGASRVFNVSVRGWLAILLIGSVCVAFVAHVLAAVSVSIYKGSMTVMDSDAIKLQIAMAERLALVALGYYFGKEEREHLRRGSRPDAREKGAE